VLIYVSLCIQDIDYERHGTVCVRCATQTGVKRADQAFQPVQHTFGYVVPGKVSFGDLLQAPIHGQSVMRRGNDEIYAGHQCRCYQPCNGESVCRRALR
jgi:hypothetical protein